MICENSIGVLLAINYFCKELSFVDVLISISIDCNDDWKYLQTTKELVDIKSFVEMGIDGFVLGSETLDKLKCLEIVKNLGTILEYLKE